MSSASARFPSENPRRTKSSLKGRWLILKSQIRIAFHARLFSIILSMDKMNNNGDRTHPWHSPTSTCIARIKDINRLSQEIYFLCETVLCSAIEKVKKSNEAHVSDGKNPKSNTVKFYYRKYIDTMYIAKESKDHKEIERCTQCGYISVVLY